MRRFSDDSSGDDASQEASPQKRFRGDDDGVSVHRGHHEDPQGRAPPTRITATFQRQSALEEPEEARVWASAGDPVCLVNINGEVHQFPANALDSLTPPANFARPTDVPPEKLWPEATKAGIPLMLEGTKAYVSIEHLATTLDYWYASKGTVVAIDARYLLYICSCNDVKVVHREPEPVFTPHYTGMLSKKYLSASNVTMRPFQIGLMLNTPKRSKRKGECEFTALV